MKSILKGASCFCLLLTLATLTNDCFAAKLIERPVDSNTTSTPTVSLLRLKMVKDTTNNDEIVIRCDNTASSKMVYGEDAPDLGGIGAEESLSSYSFDSVRLAINFLPYPGLRPKIISLFTGATSSGIYTLTSTEVDGFAPAYDLWLKDAFTGDSLRLTKDATYTFNIDKKNPATFGKKRFRVVICQNPKSAYRLTDFSASQASVGRPVQIGWKMANEHANTNYTVERSIDTGKTFIQIGSLPGTGAGEYNLSDNNPVTGQDYYRLKVVDSTNTVSHSQLVEIDNRFDKSNGDMAINNLINIYPNPVNSLVNVCVTEKPQSSAAYNITITNSSGTVVKKSSSCPAKWESGVGALKPGIYLIQVTNNKDNSLVGKSKFVKL